MTRNPLSPYFRGCWARVLQAAPGCALSWIAYEFMKTVLEAETAQKKVDTGKDFDSFLKVRWARRAHRVTGTPPSDKNLQILKGNLNEVNVAKSIGEKRNESVKL